MMLNEPLALGLAHRLTAPLFIRSSALQHGVGQTQNVVRYSHDGFRTILGRQSPVFVAKVAALGVRDGPGAFRQRSF